MKSNKSFMGAYDNLAAKKREIAEKAKSRSGKELRPLPKKQPQRFLAHFRWERIRAYWFSKAGLKRIGKIALACMLLGIIGVGALFTYYKSQLKEIQLNDLTIAETVNTYLDRNGIVLWEDVGTADYRLVVNEDEISTYVRQATVAIEDRNFYSHPGVDIAGLVRATISTVTGNGVQGGSTLTQQLIKQVYFADEAASANRGGLSRKIKELILSIELEKMYSKEQIITMYLNQSPYGGRRNGIESAAQTYFGKSAKDLNLAESALLASIPNNPGVLNPYNEYGNEDLIKRQHKTLNVMVELGYITQEECDAAKEVPILDQIQPETTQYTNIKAPHFVLAVRQQLEEQLGMSVMRAGGLTIRTTLDYRAQEMAERAVANGAEITNTNRSDNIAMVSLDVETSQVIAMVGSINWETPVYGEVNATTSLLEPGSTIKPVLDYSTLLSQKEQVWGPGSILVDENIDKVYCLGTSGACSMSNATGKFYGKITVRESLSNSLNIGAVKALKIVGIENALETLHKLGDVSYCDDSAAGLSMAIGSGCRVKMVEHANAYATVARGGEYKDLVYVLEVKDSHGNTVKDGDGKAMHWNDAQGERVLDEDVAFELSSILSDAEARARYNFGSQSYSFGFVVNGVWTASKTGTTTTSNSAVAKDSWMVSYSTSVVSVVWNGNHDGSGLASSSNTVARRVTNDYMEPVHKDLYALNTADDTWGMGSWKSGDSPAQPSGVQKHTVAGVSDFWPNWFAEDKVAGFSKDKVKFNSANGLQAADCTPSSKIEEVEVTKITDLVTGTETLIAVDEKYKYGEIDTCSTGGDGDGIITITPNTSIITGELMSLSIRFSEDDEIDLKSYEIYADGVLDKSGNITSSVVRNGISYYPGSEVEEVIVTVTDEDGATYSVTYTISQKS